MNTNRSTDEDARQRPIRVSTAGLIVRKTPSLRGEEAVVVDLTLRSGLEERQQVRIEDRIPDALVDNTVEFHPRYDPQRWTRQEDRVVYEAPIGPGIVRRTVWGIRIDDPAQLDLFKTEPSVRFVDPPADANQPADAQAAFDFKEAADESPDTARDRDRPAGSVVSALIDELRDRELSRTERTVLQRALGLDELRTDVESLQASTEELSADVGSVRTTLEREVSWREGLRRSLTADPDDP